MPFGGAVNPLRNEARNTNAPNYMSGGASDDDAVFRPFGGLPVSNEIAWSEFERVAPLGPEKETRTTNPRPIVEWLINNSNDAYLDLANSYFNFVFSLHGTTDANLTIYNDTSTADKSAPHITCGLGMIRDVALLANGSRRVSDDKSGMSYYVEVLKNALSKDASWGTGATIPMNTANLNTFVADGGPLYLVPFEEEGEGTSQGLWNFAKGGIDYLGSNGLRTTKSTIRSPDTEYLDATQGVSDKRLWGRASALTRLKHFSGVSNPAGPNGVTLETQSQYSYVYQCPDGLFSQDRYWPPNASLKVILTKNPVAFMAGIFNRAGTTDPNYTSLSIAYQQQVLMLRKVYPKESVNDQINELLAGGALYHYPLVRARVQYEIFKSQQNVFSNILIGQKCDTLSFMIVKASVISNGMDPSETLLIPPSHMAPLYVGEDQTNEANCIISEIKSIQLKVDGRYLPAVQVDTPNDLKRAYYELYAHQTMPFFNGGSPLLSFSQWKHTARIFCFSLRNDGGYLDNVNYNETADARQNCEVRLNLYHPASVDNAIVFIGLQNNNIWVDMSGQVTDDF